MAQLSPRVTQRRDTAPEPLVEPVFGQCAVLQGAASSSSATLSPSESPHPTHILVGITAGTIPLGEAAGRQEVLPDLLKEV